MVVVERLLFLPLFGGHPGFFCGRHCGEPRPKGDLPCEQSACESFLPEAVSLSSFPI